MTFYFLIPKTELTQDMIDLSTNNSSSSMAEITYLEINYYIVEVCDSNLVGETVLTGYTKLTSSQLKSLK